jgi:phage gp36-like protein
VQVTVDPALEEAMAAIDPNPTSKSRLIRDLALRGAEVAEDDRRRREEAKEFFLEVARGEIDLDLTGAQEAWEEREAEVE